MQFLETTQMKYFFAGLKHVFCPVDELKTRDIKNIFIVMKLGRQTLGEFLHSTHASLDNVRAILYNTICGLKYLHSANIVHRDLKPQNILIGNMCEAVICDFGLSRSIPKSHQGKHNGQTSKVRKSAFKGVEDPNCLPEKERNQLIIKKCNKVRKVNTRTERQLSPHVTSRWYRAPEVCLLIQQYDQAVDIWALGCIAYEMATCIKGLLSSSKKREILFQGTHCYPLSPKSGTEVGEEVCELDLDDQINKILTKIKP